MRFAEHLYPSPHYEARPHEQLGVLFHHSELSFPDTIALMTRPASRVSYHVLIDADGTRGLLVPETHVAWHAGVSRFFDREGCNDFLLGVAFAGDTYHEPLTPAQVASALEWLEPRWRARGWTPAWVTDHRQVSPGRKRDLNPREWERLHAALVRHLA